MNRDKQSEAITRAATTSKPLSTTSSERQPIAQSFHSTRETYLFQFINL